MALETKTQSPERHLEGEEVRAQRKEFRNLLAERNFSRRDVRRIMHAYIFAEGAHLGEHRDTGEAFFEHPRETARILVEEVGVRDANTVIAAFLHDSGEDSDGFGNNE